MPLDCVQAGHCGPAVPGSFRRITFAYMMRTSDLDLWRLPLTEGSHHDLFLDGYAISCDGSGYYEFKFKQAADKLDVPVFAGKGHVP